MTGTPAPYLLLQHISQQHYTYQNCCVYLHVTVSHAAVSVQSRLHLPHGKTFITTSCHTSHIGHVYENAYLGGQLLRVTRPVPTKHHFCPSACLPSGYIQALTLPKAARLICRPLGAHPFYLIAITKTLLLPIILGNMQLTRLLAQAYKIPDT